jgi:hypothetical protein
MRTISLSLLTILCLALTGFAQAIYNDGGIDGHDNAFFISGPNYLSFNENFQDISNGFIAANSGTPSTLEFGEWIVGGLWPSSISYELGTTAFGTDLGSGTVAQFDRNNHFLFSNSFGWDVYDVTIPVTSAFMTAGNEYWVTLSNATDSNNSGTEAWDLPNGGSGGPATCNYRQNGTTYGDCGSGGESFTLTTYDSWYTPEPSSIILFGSGILGLAGILRRKLNI